MAKDSESANREGTEDSREITAFSTPEAFQAAFNKRMELSSQSKESPEPKAEEEAPEEEEVADGEESENSDKEAEGKEEDVPSQFDLEELDDEAFAQVLEYAAERMSNEEKAAFAEKIGSGAGKAAGKLRSENRQLKEQIEALKKSSAESIPNSNPFKDLKTEEELNEKESQYKTAIQKYRTILRKNDFQKNENDEIGIEVNGEWYTPDDIWNFVDQWQEDLLAIPERKSQLKEERQSEERAKRAVKKLEESHKWFADEDSDERKAYDEIMADADIQLATSMIPALGAKLPALIADAVVGKNNKPIRAESKVSIRPKSSPPTKIKSSAGGRPSGNGPDASKSFKEKLFSGNVTSIKDFINA